MFEPINLQARLEKSKSCKRPPIARPFWRIRYAVTGAILFAAVCGAPRGLSENTAADSGAPANRALQVLRDGLRDQSRWVKVHAAEFLLDLSRAEGVRAAFEQELTRHEIDVPYRIGIWRVLARSGATPNARRTYIRRIIEAAIDPDGGDRVHATETLAKLGVALNTTDARAIAAWAEEAPPAEAAFAHWAATRSNDRAGVADHESRIATMLNHPDPVARLRAAYALSHLDSPAESSRRALNAAANRAMDSQPTDRVETLADAYVLSAAWKLAAAESDQTGPDQTVDACRSELERRARRVPAVAIVFANRMAVNGRSTDSTSLLAAWMDDPSTDPDLRLSAANAILHLERRRIPAPKRYDCLSARGPIRIDGRLNEPDWQRAPWSDDFVDIEGTVRPLPRFRTRVRLLWDRTNLYVGAQIYDPHVWATLARRDAYLWKENNNFEVFIDPDGDTREYEEIQINALNTVLDMFLTKPYRDGGRASTGRDLAGLTTAVHVRGTLNDPTDIDEGWTAELAIPWSALEASAHSASAPNPGDAWRINFSRVQWRHDVVDGHYRRKTDQREDNWVWSPQGAVNMHLPERWGTIRFTDRIAD